MLNADQIAGALCVYLLLGILWALFYALLESAHPGSITKGGELLKGDLIADLTYFSFVTMTTLGYGDIAPVSPAARSFAILEAILGQVYLVVLIARLVGHHIRQSADGRSVGESGVPPGPSNSG